jgi:hypothetical protein
MGEIEGSISQIYRSKKKMIDYAPIVDLSMRADSEQDKQERRK